MEKAVIIDQDNRVDSYKQNVSILYLVKTGVIGKIYDIVKTGEVKHNCKGYVIFRKDCFDVMLVYKAEYELSISFLREVFKEYIETGIIKIGMRNVYSNFVVMEIEYTEHVN